ncbi:MAG: sigma-54-dependent Fis family transcriptional regulator [Proteobacteria bacterium]|nr:sigma-54-dependent Fis family transcriptional regulator [Pseudomonadota bacterium]
MAKKILIVDDEKSMREFLEILFAGEGYQVEVAENGKYALEKLKAGRYDLVITDMQMPQMGGVELLKNIRAISSSTEVIVMTAYASTESAVEAMKCGACDYITKPFKIDEIKIIVDKIFQTIALKNENLVLKKALDEGYRFADIVGISSVMRELYDMIRQVAPANINILISGESGTGKELVARAIHSCSDREGKPFVAINCGAVPENLLESELFGHKKGAFTGATSNKEGLFDMADKGTIFLDEIGDMPLLLQVKLLRVLQEREFRPVGETSDRKVDVRIIAASNRDLGESVKKNEFREDLFYRLNVVQIKLPSLRERKEDIPSLISHFIEKHNKKLGRKIVKASSETVDLLKKYDFPGNVRELENIIERAVALESSNVIMPESLSEDVRGAERGGSSLDLIDIPEEGIDMEKTMEDMEKKLMIKALASTKGVRTKAAKLLGISFRSFRYRLSKFGIEDD